MSYRELKHYNPWFRRSYVDRGTHKLVVPRQAVEGLLAAMEGLEVTGRGESFAGAVPAAGADSPHSTPAAAQPPAAGQPPAAPMAGANSPELVIDELYVDGEADPDEGAPPLSVKFTSTIEDATGATPPARTARS